MRWLRRIHEWTVGHKDPLSAWSSVVTIVSVPAVAIGLVVGWFQIRDLLRQPTVEIEFKHAASVAYEVVNPSDRVAEDVLVSFGLFDLDSDLQSPVPIPSVAVPYVNPRSRKGPFSFLQQFGTSGHRYFGIVYIGCRGCEDLKTYWLYVRHGDSIGNFYAKRSAADPFQVDVGRLAHETNRELAVLVPEGRRTYIR